MTDPERIKEIIESATVDCHNDEEMFTGWGVMFQDAIGSPFQAAILGKPVQVLGCDVEQGRGPRCEIRTEDGRQRWVGIDSLDDDTIPDTLREVMDAYDAWLDGDY